MAWTESIRRELPAIAERFGIRSMIDAPCGDLFWIADPFPPRDMLLFAREDLPNMV